jgi:hypothetical protein
MVDESKSSLIQLNWDGFKETICSLLGTLQHFLQKTSKIDNLRKYISYHDIKICLLFGKYNLTIPCCLVQNFKSVTKFVFVDMFLTSPETNVIVVHQISS